MVPPLLDQLADYEPKGPKDSIYIIWEPRRNTYARMTSLFAWTEYAVEPLAAWKRTPDATIFPDASVDPLKTT